MRPRIIPLAKEHLEAAVYRPDHARYILALGDSNAAIERNIERNGGVALVLGDEVLAMAGIAMFWSGTGQLWMRTCLNAHLYPVAVWKAAKTYLATVDEVVRPRRIQAHVKKDMAVNRRFIKRLGFKPEAIMRSFGPEGADYVLYARVKG